MEKNNNKINTFQLTVLCVFIANALFVGFGITNIFTLAKQDAWIVTINALIFSIIPLLILIYILGYHPEKNIFEKNTLLFGKIIGNIINMILFIYVAIILVIVLKATTVFAITMYLTKTPNVIIAGIYVLAAIYATIKGIETIARTSQIIFFISIMIIGVIILTLYPLFIFDELKPILQKGIMPVIYNSFIYLSYSITPLIVITVIPKNDVINNKHYNKCLLLGVLIAFILMFSIFYIIPGVITPKLTELYRFPAYYVQRKISIGGAINNVENFTAAHWFFNTFVLIEMGIYFLCTYIKGLFKIKKKKIMNMITIGIGIIIVYISTYTFTNPVSLTKFGKESYPQFVSLGVLIIVIILCVMIFIKKRKEQKAT